MKAQRYCPCKKKRTILLSFCLPCEDMVENGHLETRKKPLFSSISWSNGTSVSRLTRAEGEARATSQGSGRLPEDLACAFSPAAFVFTWRMEESGGEERGASPARLLL